MAFVVVLTCTVSLSAADLPARKAGLWEMTTTANGRTMPIKQCIDAATDQAMQANTSQSSQRSCSKRDIKKSGDTTTVDSVCTAAGKTLTHHMVITGSFDSGYTMTIRTEGDGIPAARNITIAAKWTGPCAADQKPGDMIMQNGTKINLVDMTGGAARRAAAAGREPRQVRTPFESWTAARIANQKVRRFAWGQPSNAKGICDKRTLSHIQARQRTARSRAVRCLTESAIEAWRRRT